MKDEILKVFKEINALDASYYVLRDFDTIENIVSSRDIDIYLNSKDLKNVSKIMFENGWYTPKFNDNKYPHIQFYKMIEGKVCKFDFVTDLYYGRNNYYIKNNLINNSIFDRVDIIKVGTNINSLITMVLHIIFDKENLSQKNRNILTNMLKKTIKSDFKNENEEFYNIAEELTTLDIDDINNNINKYKEILLKYLSLNKIKNATLNFKRILLKILKKLQLVFSNRSICFVGVDGSGKSSVIDEMNKKFKECSKIVYMGQKDYKNSVLRKLVQKEKCNVFQKIIKRFLMVIEQFERYFRYRYSENIVLFDRYADDSFINTRKSERLFNVILFKYIFPRPQMKIYMYCDTAISFDRKSDIVDREEFTKMKQRYDKYYLNNKNVTCICTDNTTSEDVIKLISKEINSKYPLLLI